jgi:hypothetical protein
MMIKNMKIETLAKEGREMISACTYFLILGTAFMLLNGLKTLRVLSALKFILPPRKDISPVRTTKKSIIFHPSLRYE